MIEILMAGVLIIEILMAGALIVGGMFFIVACLLPIISEPGKDGWRDVE